MQTAPPRPRTETPTVSLRNHWQRRHPSPDQLAEFNAAAREQLATWEHVRVTWEPVSRRLLVQRAANRGDGTIRLYRNRRTQQRGLCLSGTFSRAGLPRIDRLALPLLWLTRDAFAIGPIPEGAE